MSKFDKFMHGAPVLNGNNTIPGLKLPKEIVDLIPKIFKAVKDFGCDYPPTIVEKLRYNEISEVAAYGGFPVRWPHWKWGMEYEELQKGYELNLHRIYEMVVNCVGLETRVLTNRGTILAKDVKVGDDVFKGKDSRKVILTKLQAKSPTKVIHIDGYLPLTTCTYEHKWKVLSNTGLLWKLTQDLQSGDIIVGDDNYSSFQCRPAKFNWDKEKILSETRLNVRYQLKPINPPAQMTLELASLLGALIGDGSNGVNGNPNDVYVTVGYGKDEDEYAKRIENLFYKVFGQKASVQEKPSARIVMLQSKYAVDFLDSLGYPKGCTYKDKRVPKSIFESSQEFRAAFLRDYFDTDGYTSDGLGCSAYNPDLISDIQLLLAEMGIASEAETITNGFGKEGDQKWITVLSIRGYSNLSRFRDYIGFNIQYKKDGLDALLNTEYCQSRGIRVEYLQQLIMNWGNKQGITTYNNTSLGYSLNYMKKQLVGFNCLYSFVRRAIKQGMLLDKEILDISALPLFVVKELKEGPEVETIDIALDHGEHDFIANGLVTHNTNPVYLYCLESNSILDDVTVIAHALGHADFFKNNIFFSQTNQNMMNELANHGTRIRRYIARWGKERVTAFLDQLLRIETLIDPAKAWERKHVEDLLRTTKEDRDFRFAPRLKVSEGHDYMEPYLNPPEWTKKSQQRIQREDVAAEIGVLVEPTKDIFGFIRDYAPLKPWQADIVDMLYEETMYFAPQRMTKTLNEGWASYIDFNMMARQGMSSWGQKEGPSSGIIEYSIHKMGVLGSKYSMNPYKLGFSLFLDIEDRWNKGKFGDEWDSCQDYELRKNWDKKLNLGHEKVFEVRKYYDDVTALIEFFTPDFCEEYEFFEWKLEPNGEYKIASRDHKRIKKQLIRKYLNGGLPEIKLVDNNHKGKGYLMLEHTYDGRGLHQPYVKGVMNALSYLWKNEVFLTSKNDNQDELVYWCPEGSVDLEDDEKNVTVLSREDYDELKS